MASNANYVRADGDGGGKSCIDYLPLVASSFGVGATILALIMMSVSPNSFCSSTSNIPANIPAALACGCGEYADGSFGLNMGGTAYSYFAISIRVLLAIVLLLVIGTLLIEIRKIKTAGACRVPRDSRPRARSLRAPGIIPGSYYTFEV